MKTKFAMEATLRHLVSRPLRRSSVPPRQLLTKLLAERQRFVNDNKAEPNDRRRFKRFQLHLRAFFWWKSAEGKRRFASGTTRDVGPHGVFITSKTGPAVHTMTNVELLLPANGARQMRMRGQVVRAELQQPEQSYGFAVYSAKKLTINSKRIQPQVG